MKLWTWSRLGRAHTVAGVLFFGTGFASGVSVIAEGNWPIGCLVLFLMANAALNEFNLNQAADLAAEQERLVAALRTELLAKDSLLRAKDGMIDVRGKLLRELAQIIDKHPQVARDVCQRLMGDASGDDPS